jgi:hypothetical protein
MAPDPEMFQAASLDMAGPSMNSSSARVFEGQPLQLKGVSLNAPDKLNLLGHQQSPSSSALNGMSENGGNSNAEPAISKKPSGTFL